MTHDEVVRELRSLRAENRRLRRWGGAVLGLLLAAGATAMAREDRAPEVLRAGRFEVVGAEGKVRASLGLDDSGAPRLRMTDGDGVERLSLRLDPEGRAHVAMADHEGRALLTMDVTRIGAPSLWLRSVDHLRHVGLTTDRDNAELVLVGSDGRTRGRLSIDSRDLGSLELRDQAGPRVVLGHSDRASPASWVRLHGLPGTASVDLRIDDAGGTGLDMSSGGE